MLYFVSLGEEEAEHPAADPDGPQPRLSDQAHRQRVLVFPVKYIILSYYIILAVRIPSGQPSPRSLKTYILFYYILLYYFISSY